MNGSAITAEFGHDKGRAGPSNRRRERHVAGEPVELGNQHGALGDAGCPQRCELRAPMECIGALAGFRFDELCENLQSFRLREAPDGGALPA
jgi:hypothetical protein